MAKGIDYSFLAAMAAKVGVDIDMGEVKETETLLSTAQELDTIDRADRVREADAILSSLHAPHSAGFKKCAWCGEVFRTNYCAVSCCSIRCRKMHLEAHFKMKWDPRGSKIWGDVEEPLVLSGESTAQLYEWAKHFIEKYEAVRDDHSVQDDPNAVVTQTISIDSRGVSRANPLAVRRSGSLSPQEVQQEEERSTEILARPSESSERYQTEESEHTSVSDLVDDILSGLLD